MRGVRSSRENLFMTNRYLVGAFVAGMILAYVGNYAEIPLWIMVITALGFGSYLGAQARRKEKNAKADTDMHT